MKTTRNNALKLVALVGICGCSSSIAAITALTNGDFQTDALAPGGNDTGVVPGWFTSSTTAVFDEFRYDSTGNGGWTGTGFDLAFDGGDDGYAYQQIGTYAGETSITFNGTVYNRTNGAYVGNWDISFRYGTFTGADGSDVVGSTILIGTVGTFDQDDTAIVSGGLVRGTTATSSAFSHTVSFAGSSISNGDAVWVRIGDGTQVFQDEAIFDNLSVITVIPEPGSIALCGLAGLGLLLRRKR